VRRRRSFDEDANDPRLPARGGLVAVPVTFGPVVVGQSEAQLDPMGASSWTATISGGEEEPFEVEGHATVHSSDPRISGALSQARTIRMFPNREPGADDLQVASAAVRIDNDHGAWVGSFTGSESAIAEWNELEGEGDYEGLTAVFRWLPDDTMEGVIVPGALPAVPDPVAPPAEG
jgi:hypothetical protein